GNSVSLSSTLSAPDGPIAFAGGIGIGAQATIARTIVSDNSLTAADVGGLALAFGGGILDEGSLVLSDSTVARNRIDASIPASSAGSTFAGGGGIEVDGAATIRDSRFVA